MAAFAGLRGTGSFGTDERPKDFREMILWLRPNGSAPLTALMAKTRKMGLDDPEFNWFEEKLQLTRLQVNVTTTYNSSATTVVLASGNGLEVSAGDVLQIEKTEGATYDNELVVVSSVTDANTIVVKRGQAGSTATTLAASGFMTRLGPVFEEGSLGPPISSKNPAKLFNYAQIFKTGIGQTETSIKTKYRTGNAWENDKKRGMFKHSTALELAFMFGRKYEDLTGSHPKRYTGGLRQFLTTNVTIFTTTPTEDAFMDAIFPVFNWDTGGAGDERIILAGNGALNSLNRLARNSDSTRINFDGTITTYGMNLQKWVLPQGTVGIRTHPLMNQHSYYTNSMFVIDPTGLRYRALRDTRFKDNTQPNDKDSREAYWLTEAGLEVNHEETMAYIGNFVVPAS